MRCSSERADTVLARSAMGAGGARLLTAKRWLHFQACGAAVSVDARTGFAVIYQWRVKAGREAEFQQAWEELTQLLRIHRGARGSRLHRTDYGSLVAYAQWPDQAA